jgi:hypothetical protein
VRRVDHVISRRAANDAKNDEQPVKDERRHGNAVCPDCMQYVLTEAPERCVRVSGWRRASAQPRTASGRDCGEDRRSWSKSVVMSMRVTRRNRTP